MKRFFIYSLLIISFLLCGCNDANISKTSETKGKSESAESTTESMAALSTNENGQTETTTESRQTETMSESSGAETTTEPETSTTATEISQNTIETNKPGETECKYLVFGKELQSESKAYINYKKEYVEIPFIATVEALGGEVKWINEIKAEVILNEERFELNIAEKSLIKENTRFNWFNMPPGGSTNGYLYYNGIDFMVDRARSWYFIRDYANGDLNVDYKKGIISIDPVN